MSQDYLSRFIDEEIEVEFDIPLVLEKTPTCPNRFFWRDEVFHITESLSEWRDFTRRGRSARNMRPGHASTASIRGSLGVGRFYFQVRTQFDRFFVIYYDRAPKDALRRHGTWFLYQELLRQ